MYVNEGALEFFLKMKIIIKMEKEIVFQGILELNFTLLESDYEYFSC